MHSPFSRRFFLAMGASALGLAYGRKGHGENKPIRFGLTPVFLDSDIQLLNTLKSYLSRVVGQEVDLIKRRTYQEITLMLLSDEIDAAWICGFPFVRYQTQLSLLAVPLYQNEPLYQSYLIVNDKTDAQDFSDMRGHAHAFSDPDSNSGFLVTRALLAEIDEKPETFFSRSFFTYGHRNVIRAVNSGLAQSGSVDGYVWDVMADTEPELVANTKVIRKSEKMGFPPIACARGNEKNSAVVQIRDALLSIDQDQQGKEVLEALHLDGFTRGSTKLFEPIAHNLALVQAQS